jgi:hypothetical protein
MNGSSFRHQFTERQIKWKWDSRDVEPDIALKKSKGVKRMNQMIMKGVALLGFFGILLLGPWGTAQAEEKWSGTMFGDLYWVSSHHTDANEGQNGFVFRRIYLTYDRDLAEGFTSRFRFETTLPDFTATAAKFTPAVKDAYLQWKHDTHSTFFGLSTSPTFDEVESFWGLRPVEKSPLDFYRWGSSRDIGVAMRGYFDSSRKFGYHAMIGNGSDTSQETNEGKKLMLALDMKLGGGAYVQLYGDHEKDKGGTSSHSSITTYQLFTGWKGDRGRAGLLYANQVREQGSAANLDLTLYSLFGVVNLSNEWSVFARADRHADPNPEMDKIPYFGLSKTGATDTNTAEDSTLLVVGLDHSHAGGTIHIMPNVEVFQFGKNKSGQEPGSVVIPRLTLSWQFK